MEVKLLDLSRQWKVIKDEVKKNVDEVFEECGFVLGRAVSRFEEAMADFCGVPGAVGVASGTDALLLSLRVLGVEKGEEVITSPYSFFATAGAIWNCGGRPVFVDIDPATYNIDADRIEAAMTPRTRAILPVHLYGQMADMDPILAIAEKHGVGVVEDAAQSVGAEYKGKRAGSLGTLGAVSFFPSKNLGGAGDGGMIVGKDDGLLGEIRLLRGHGAKNRYFHEKVGFNSRLDSLQAAVLAVKLRYLDEWSEERRNHAAVYDAVFLEMDEVVPPLVLEGCSHIYNQYIIRARRRDELKEFLEKRGIGCAIYYPLSLHEQECFRSLGYARGAFPESERAAAETLSIPVYPELTAAEQQYVIDSVKEFYAR
jgi:dTDP-4-amino-4,6-dideoxygalactose transaminase